MDTKIDNKLQAAMMRDPLTTEDRADALFPSIFWHAYKGHNRGGLTGLALGAIVGAVAGAAVAGVVVLAHLAAPAVALLAIPALMGSAAVMGWETFGPAGSAATSRASALAEEHVRKRDPLHLGNALSALDDQLLTDGRGHHYEFPPDRDQGKTFYWKSGLIGAAIAAGVGALASFSPEFAEPILHMVEKIPGVGGSLIHVAGPAGVLAATAAMGGLSFGVDRSHFKSIHNRTDKVIHGKSPALGGVDIEQYPQLAGKTQEEIAQMRIQRQHEVEELEKEYSKKIFQSGLNGSLRGMAGGAVVGALTGAALGLLMVGVIGLVAASAAPALAVAAVTVAGFAASGSAFGMKIFAEAGSEAGAESMARAIDTKFERDQILISKGITPTKEIEPESDGQWFNGAQALTAGAIGALIGVVVAPVLAPGILATVGLTTAAPAVMASVSAAVTAVGAAGVGGIGSSLKKMVSNAADSLYYASYFREDDHPSHMKSMQQLERAPIAPSTPIHEQVSMEDAERLNRRMNAQGTTNFEQLVARDKMNSNSLATSQGHGV